MPTPKKGEKRDAFISRCMSQVSDEDPKKPLKARLGKCFGIWRQGPKK